MNTAHQITYQEQVNSLITTTSNKAFVDAVINDWCDELQHHIKIKHGFDTACWTFHNGSHYVYIGTEIFEHVLKTANGEDYVTALLHHELAHAMWTSRELVKLSNKLENSNIPFKLFNLFEDARIEHKWRLHTFNCFNWQKLNKPFKITSPIDYFFALIFFEGSTDCIDADYDFDALDVIRFYSNTLSANGSFDLIPILTDWIELYGDQTGTLPENAMPSSGVGQSGHDCDLKCALQVALDGNLNSIDENSESVENTTKPLDTSGSSGSKSAGVISANGKVAFQARSFPYDDPMIRNSPIQIDQSYADEMAFQISNVFKARMKYKGTRKPSRKLNMRAMSGNKDLPMYSRKTVLARAKIDVNLFIDCSGSMYYAMDDATVIVSVFNLLSIRGLINCKVILSSDRADAFPVIELPVTQDDALLIAEPQSGCGEGLESCFKANLGIMKRAKYNFVITDGDLVDEPINKAYYQSRGIFTIGLYSGEDDLCDELTKWFDIGIKRNGLDSLFASIVQVLKS